MAELAALRDTAVDEATELRALELERLDGMTSGLWPQVQQGRPPAVMAAVRVSERRSRLLGLDEPTATRTELTGSLSVTAKTEIKTQVELLQAWLSFEELAELGAKTDGLFTDASALATDRSTRMLVGVPASPAAAIHGVLTGVPVGLSTRVPPCTRTWRRCFGRRSCSWPRGWSTTKNVPPLVRRSGASSIRL